MGRTIISENLRIDIEYRNLGEYSTIRMLEDIGFSRPVEEHGGTYNMMHKKLRGVRAVVNTFKEKITVLFSHKSIREYDENKNIVILIEDELAKRHKYWSSSLVGSEEGSHEMTGVRV